MPSVRRLLGCPRVLKIHLPQAVLKRSFRWVCVIIEGNSALDSIFMSKEFIVSQSRNDLVQNNMDSDERRDLHDMLQETRAEVKALEHDVRQQVSVIASYEKAQKSIRLKLDKTRTESATHKTIARHLKRDCERLRQA